MAGRQLKTLIRSKTINPIVRPTGILIEDGKILIVKQEVSRERHWSLPGGKLEYGETIEQCLVREVKEETGIDIKVKEMLYVTDRFRHMNNHIVHISFLVERLGKKLKVMDWKHQDEKMVREVKMVPLEELTRYGFSKKFYELVKMNFPGCGTYQGDFHKFYDEP
jgi:mutator protein MutT